MLKEAYYLKRKNFNLISVNIVVCASGDILINVIYRSPNSDKYNNNDLSQLMQEIGDTKTKFKVVIRDFNLPNINGDNYTSRGGPQ